MSLLGLPTELLDGIIGLTLFQGDFENVILICKATHSAGKGYIPRYNALKRKWRHTNTSRSTHPRSTLDILRAIAHEPFLANFIETLNLVDATDQNDTAPSKGSADEDDGRLLAQLVEESSYLPLANQDATVWIEAMQLGTSTPPEGEEDGPGHRLIYRTVFLLTLLPKLMELSLPAKWSVLRHLPTTECAEVLETIMRQAHEPAGQDMALGKLERLCPFAEIEYDPMPRGGLGIVSIFMHLPHLTSLSVSDLIAVTDGYTGIPFTWDFWDIPCNLTHIDLHGCCVDATNVSELLKHTPLVTSFRHSQHVKWHGCQYDWNAGAFVKAIGDQCGERLTDLSVTLMQHFGEIENGVTAMQQFTVIEDLELDVAVFAAPATDSGFRLGLAGPNPDNWSLEAMPELSDILPLSVKRVRLNVKGEEDLGALSQLFRNFKDSRGKIMFRQLDSVVVRSAISIDGDDAGSMNEALQQSQIPLRRLLEVAGVQVEEQ